MALVTPPVVSMFRLAGALRRLAARLGRGDPPPAWAAELEDLARRVRREPRAAAEEALALFEGRGPLRRPPDATGEPSRLRRRLYRAALALWRATRGESPLAVADDGAPVTQLVDYGAGCEVWRRGRTYVVRHDVGPHVSCWREDRISRREAEQALLGPEHFHLMTEALQRRLRARGADLYAGSTRPLPPPVFE